MRRVMGMDPSLAGFGLVAKHGNKIRYKHLRTKPLPNNKTPTGIKNGVFLGGTEARINYLVAQTMQLYKRFLPDAIFIEGYSFGSHSRSVTPLAELRGVLYNALWHQNAVWVEVAPPTLKKASTGSGRASKGEMLETAREVWPTCQNDDLADAFLVACYGEEHFDELITVVE